MTNKPISLYFHIPFCARKCDYCAFYSLTGVSDGVRRAYAEALIRQVGFFDRTRTVGTVYFGGGTPSVLGVERICEVLQAVKNELTVAPDCEITVEVNPGMTALEHLQLLRAAGFNRLSVGIQSASDRVLTFLSRLHTFTQAKECIANARKAGFDNISADIIFALPEQSLDEFKYSVDAISDLEPDHISAYSLQLEEGTPLYNRSGELEFPSEDEEEAQYAYLCDTLERKGFIQYEISSFAKCGRESRHNSAYWDLTEYFGFGAGAHSFYLGKRFETKCDIEAYIGSVTSLLSPTGFNEEAEVTEKELAEDAILLGLRTKRGAIIPKSAHAVASRIASLGYGVFDGARLVLNRKGFRVSNEIIAEILTAE